MRLGPWLAAGMTVALAGCGPQAAAPDAAVPIRHSVADEDAGRRPGPIAPDAAAASAPDADGEITDLPAEERDSDPRSRIVKLKLLITPPARGTVVWGRKKLADLKPGQMAVEIDRPRGSGPLDLLVRAEGFLPHHVRLFTDRDDRLSLRLIRPDDARGMLGYRRPAVPAPP